MPKSHIWPYVERTLRGCKDLESAREALTGCVLELHAQGVSRREIGVYVDQANELFGLENEHGLIRRVAS